jgi:hypothetical protein
MAQTQISDVVVPSVFAPYVQLLSTSLSLLIKTGVILTDPLLDQFVRDGGQFIDMPHFNDLGDTEANISGDSPSDVIAANYGLGTPSPRLDSTPENITTGQTRAVRHNRNQSWSSMDLAAQLAGADPMDAIASRVAGYWTRQDQLQLNASIEGIIADNVANDSSDMVNDISTSGAITDANRFSADAFIDAMQTMGDHKTMVSAIGVHSVVHARMQKLNLIDFVPDSEANVGFGTYQGKPLIVDDGMSVTLNGANTRYWTQIYGPGVFGLGTGSPRVPSEVERQGAAGNGGGQEILYSRREFLLHPQGFNFEATTGSGMVGQSPTNAELALAATWNRVYGRKLIPFAVLQTNG